MKTIIGESHLNSPQKTKIQQIVNPPISNEKPSHETSLLNVGNRITQVSPTLNITVTFWRICVISRHVHMFLSKHTRVMSFSGTRGRRSNGWKNLDVFTVRRFSSLFPLWETGPVSMWFKDGGRQCSGGGTAHSSTNRIRNTLEIFHVITRSVKTFWIIMKL